MDCCSGQQTSWCEYMSDFVIFIDQINKFDYLLSFPKTECFDDSCAAMDHTLEGKSSWPFLYLTNEKQWSHKPELLFYAAIELYAVVAFYWCMFYPLVTIRIIVKTPSSVEM